MSLSIDEAIKKVLSFLKSIPMAPATVKCYSCCCSHVRDYCQRNALQEFSYKDAASFTAEQLKLAENGKFGKIYALIMRKAAYYVADCFETGTLEWKRNRYTITELPENYQQILGSFEESISGKLAEGSVYNIIHEIRKFLKYLEKAGCLTIQDLSADILRAYVIQEAPKHMGNYVNLTWPLKKFLAYVKKSGVALSGTFDFLLANPAPVHERVLPAFDDDETKAILESIDTSTKQGRRDYAVVMLALDTGLRWSDIAKMQLSDILWEKREIRVKQEKTDTPLTLPLTLRAGTAVADYILEARPKCSSPYVFLRLRKPYSSMLSSASPTKDLMGRYFKKNGIEHHFGDGKTFHGLRRTMGTNLVRNGTPLEEVSQILGHRDINSSRHYISLHDEMLAECCMDISMFATEKEGLQ